jgi:hypothetical protein
LRRGLADFHRRAQVCQQINERFLRALAQLDDDTTLQELTQPGATSALERSTGERALRPFSPEDQPWLQAVNRAEFTGSAEAVLQ